MLPPDEYGNHHYIFYKVKRCSKTRHILEILQIMEDDLLDRYDVIIDGTGKIKKLNSKKYFYVVWTQPQFHHFKRPKLAFDIY